MSKQYNTCPDCGANLDPGEKCDCKDKMKEIIENIAKETSRPPDMVENMLKFFPGYYAETTIQLEPDFGLSDHEEYVRQFAEYKGMTISAARKEIMVICHLAFCNSTYGKFPIEEKKNV